MGIDVIILTDSRDPEMTQRTIDSVKSAGDVNVILVCKREDYKIYRGIGVYVVIKEAFNYNRFINHALEYISNDWVLISNDDVLYHPDWFNEMMKVHEQHPKIESFSPRDTVLHKVWFPHLFTNKETHHEGYQVTELFQGWSVLIKREALERVIPLDEQFDMYYQDNDLAQCLKKKKVRHALVKDSIADHKNTHTIGMPMSEEKIEKLAEDELKFRNKWNIWT
jgi:glycosyltransferase involved in cell wall biosynthesis